MRAVLVATLLLAGCSGTQPLLSPRVETQEVRVPVTLPCLEPADVPIEADYPDEALTVDTPLDVAIRALLIGREMRKNMETRFRALVEGCVRR